MTFAAPLSGTDQDETETFRPRFDSNGLIAAIAQDADSGEILMLAWMNAEALEATIESGLATYWSRSRNELWRKGDTSGHFQTVVELFTDCDQDAVLMKIRQVGAACHTGRKGCFYRKVDGVEKLVFG